MEQKPKNNNKLVQNILIAMVAGVITGMILGGLLPLLGLTLPTSATSAGVGIAIGLTFVTLNNRKEK